MEIVTNIFMVLAILAFGIAILMVIAVFGMASDGNFDKHR